MGPTPVESNSPLLTHLLGQVDQLIAAAENNVPGLQRQIAVLTGAEQGPFKLAISLQFAPQLRLTFGRTTFGLPQSKQQLIQWLEDPFLQLRTDAIEVRTLRRRRRRLLMRRRLQNRQEFYTQSFLNFILVDPPFDPLFNNPFIMSRKLLGEPELNATRVAGQQAGCVHACLDGDFQRPFIFGAAGSEAALPAAPPAVLIDGLPLPRRRQMADIGPFSFPRIPDAVSLQLVAAKVKAAVRSTISDALNTRFTLRVVPFVEAIPIIRIGEQYQQRLDGMCASPAAVGYAQCLLNLRSRAGRSLFRSTCGSAWRRPWG